MTLLLLNADPIVVDAAKYSEDQPRDADGKFGSGGIAAVVPTRGQVSIVAPKYSPDQPRDHGRFAGGDGEWSSQVRLEGPGWTPAAESDVHAGLERIHEAFPRAPRIDKVEIVPDQHALGNKSHTSITVSPMFVDDEKMAAHARDFGEHWDRPMLHGTGREFTIVHEYAHVLDGPSMPKEQRDALHAYVTEPVSYKVGGQEVTVPRWQAGDGSMPSAYAGESRYEYTAEAVTDALRNGDRAQETSKAILAIYKQAYA